MKAVSALAALWLLLFSFQVSRAQSSIDSLVEGKILSPAEAQEDYDILYSSLQNYHPDPYGFTEQADLEAFYQKTSNSLKDSISEREFYIMARQLISLIKCGHTTGGISSEWYQGLAGQAVMIPFSIIREGNRVLIANTVDQEFDFTIGDELLSINGIAIEKILARLDSIQTRDGYTQHYAPNAVARNFRMFYLFQYGYQETYQIEYKSAEQIHSCIIKPQAKRLQKLDPLPLAEGFEVLLENTWSRFAMDSLHQIAYLQIKSFSDRKEYKDYYQEVFENLSRYPEAKLIIDLRDNSGGYFGHGNYFLRYLMKSEFEFNFQRSKAPYQENEYAELNFWSKLTRFAFRTKPKVYKSDKFDIYTFKYKPKSPRFAGPVHIIINGFTFSQAAIVSANLHQQGATFYGTETGGLEQTHNAMLSHTVSLAHSNFKAYIPYYQARSISEKGVFGRGILPDYELLPSFKPTTDQILLQVLQIIYTSGLHQGS